MEALTEGGSLSVVALVKESGLGGSMLEVAQRVRGRTGWESPDRGLSIVGRVGWGLGGARNAA